MLTALFSTRLITLEPEPDLSPITSAPLHDKVPSKDGGNLTRSVIRKFWRLLGYRTVTKVPKSLHWSKYHITYKAGPNGPALLYALEDWQSLSDKDRESISILGGPAFQANLDKLNEFAPPKEGGKTRKLSWFSDMEGKTRVIAILDYFSQSVLRPLHNKIYKILSRIRQDCTFDQGKFITLSKG